jgi:very-short-patch-repair endonuclease
MAGLAGRRPGELVHRAISQEPWLWMGDAFTSRLPRVQGMDTRISTLIAEQGFIAVADQPRLRWALSQLKAEGKLQTPLPGIYLPAGFSPGAWLRAVSAWAAPLGVLNARTAASLWLPELVSPVAFVAHPSLRSRRGVAVSRRTVPCEFVNERDGIRFVTPAYAAVELAATDDGRAACEALRLRLADTDTLAAALACLRGSPGHTARRKAVAACAENPWSYAELRLHRILRQARVTDWVANRPLRLGDRQLWPDIRFKRRLLILEFDGRKVHNDPIQFLTDRERWNLFEAFGYHVLHFGWEHLDRPDYVVAATRAALRIAAPA